MPKINVLATAFGKPITTKTALKQLINTSPEVVRFLPADSPTPLTERLRKFQISPFAQLPASVVLIAHSPTGRKWTAEITRNQIRQFHNHNGHAKLGEAFSVK